MKQEAMQKHPEEWFFLHNFDVDRVFSTIRRTDYLVLFYIKMRQESHPDEKLYLADLAAEMGVKVTELSKGIEKLQDQGYVRWLTDREAGRTYVELTSKAVELMAEERDFMKRCYARLRTELGDDELRRTITEKCEGDLGRKVFLIEKVDPSIIGGLVLEARGQRRDISVKTQLRAAREALVSTSITNGGEA